MIDTIFIAKLVASFLVGGAWVATTTVATERHGSIIGGLVGGMPSTILISLFFIAFTQDSAAAARAASILPVAIASMGIFLVVYGKLAARGFWNAIIPALLVWTIPAFLAAYFEIDDLRISLLIFTIIVIPLFFTLGQSDFSIHPTLRPSHTQLAARGGIAGAVIASAVLFARLLGPLWGGTLAGFPAGFLSTFYILSRAHGSDATRALVYPLFVSGMANLTAYSVAAHFAYPAYGLIGGTVASYLVSLVSTAGTYQYLKRT